MEEHPKVSFSHPHSNQILLLIKVNLSFLVPHSHFYVAAKSLVLNIYCYNGYKESTIELPRLILVMLPH